MKIKKTRPFLWLLVLCGLVFVLPFPRYAFSEKHKPEKILRLTIKYENGKMDLLKVDSLLMVVPVRVTEQAVKGELSPDEFFFEIQDKRKNTILRSNMENPTESLMEYEDPENPGGIKSQIVKHEGITFSILVPALENSQFVRFARVPKEQRSVNFKMQKHEELGTFDLIEVQKRTSKIQ